MLRTVVFAGLLCLTCGPADHVDDITLAANGKSDYQIVLPDETPSPEIDSRLNEVARLVQNVFKANGCSVPIVAEKERNTSNPGLYLGNTAFARANDVDVASLEGWSYVHKVVGKNVIVAGHDEPTPATTTEGARAPRDRVGTLKGVADFLRQYAGTRFLYPARDPDDETSIEFAKVERITVPADLNIVKSPRSLSTIRSGRRKAFIISPTTISPALISMVRPTLTATLFPGTSTRRPIRNISTCGTASGFWTPG